MTTPTEADKLIAQALTKESDRGCVILSAAWLNEALEELLRSVCRSTPEDIRATIDPLFQGYAPLATFSARIQLAFGLGILPHGLRDKIEIIRRMRNDFAHESGPVDFNDSRCANRLNLLLLPTDNKQYEEQRDTLTRLAALAPTYEQLVTRIAFAICVARIIGAIDGLVDSAKLGLDLRPIVRHMEEQGLWVGPT